ncbi:MAG: porin family protein [Methylobacter tundripaludum]|nr:porin family protein [Methylobacter tundripaludum]
MAGALVSPQAMALSKADRVAEAANNKVDALEAQMQAMQAELSRLKAAANRPSADAGKVQELDQWMNSVKSAPKESKRSKDNMVFFRGGFAHMNRGRNDLLTGGQTILNSGTTDKSGYDLGAGFDFSLNDNLFGLMDNTEVLAELMFEYKNYDKRSSQATVLGTNTLCATSALTVPGANANITGPDCGKVTVSQFTLSAAPKVKFMKGSALRPWVIPVGLAMHVISPPSNGVTVFNPGAMFALGADYKIWKDIYVGADARYHWTANNADGVNTDGYTAGGYLGLGF